MEDKKQKVLRRLLPESVIREVRCFVLYDHHPMDVRQLDITICTKYELQEYYQRELRSSFQINNISEIKILRNFKCELHYLVYSNNDIIILSSKNEQISILKTITSIHNVTIQDIECTGQPILKIVRKDDALPLVFDNNFHITKTTFPFNQPDTRPESVETPSIINQLRNKLTEARYTTKCNENTYKEYVKIRQLAAFSMYQKTGIKHSNVNCNLKQISGALKVNIQVPIVKICNKKIVVILNLFNNNSKPMENVHILLHGSSLPSISYTTKIFNKTSISPYFKETDTYIKSSSESFVIAIIDIKELKYNITSRLDFDVVLSYKMKTKSCLLPFKSVSISAMDTMDVEFDVLANENDFNTIVLAIIATSDKVDLQLRCLKEFDAFTRVFQEYLNMKSYHSYENVAIHRESPYHVLYGVMVVFDAIQNQKMNVEVYTRHPSQALALIHYMNDRIPHQIIATTPEVKIRPIKDLVNDLSEYNEDQDAIKIDNINYDLSIIKQIKLIQEYICKCIEKMNQEGSDNRINYMALGLPKYLEFRRQVLRELQIPQYVLP